VTEGRRAYRRGRTWRWVVREGTTRHRGRRPFAARCAAVCAKPSPGCIQADETFLRPSLARMVRATVGVARRHVERGGTSLPASHAILLFFTLRAGMLAHFFPLLRKRGGMPLAQSLTPAVAAASFPSWLQRNLPFSAITILLSPLWCLNIHRAPLPSPSLPIAWAGCSRLVWACIWRFCLSA